ncbi:MAG TPA: hypothetical protein PLV23_06515 [Sedimentibacter sp.]|nr:hypothetical protein [Sedimentibacter sp.]
MSILIIYRYPANVKRKNTRLECFFPGVIIESALIFVYLLAFIRKYNIRGCRYCMDCGHGVDIPGVSAIYNDYKRSLNFIVNLCRIHKRKIIKISSEHLQDTI